MLTLSRFILQLQTFWVVNVFGRQFSGLLFLLRKLYFHFMVLYEHKLRLNHFSGLIMYKCNFDKLIFFWISKETHNNFIFLYCMCYCLWIHPLVFDPRRAFYLLVLLFWKRSVYFIYWVQQFNGIFKQDCVHIFGGSCFGLIGGVIGVPLEGLFLNGSLVNIVN